MMFKAGNPYWRGRLSMVDPSLLTSLGAAHFDNENVTYLFYKTNHLNWEVNCKKTSLSVRLPCLKSLGTEGWSNRESLFLQLRDGHWVSTFYERNLCCNIELFVTLCHFHSSLIFASKAGAYLLRDFPVSVGSLTRVNVTENVQHSSLEWCKINYCCKKL